MFYEAPVIVENVELFDPNTNKTILAGTLDDAIHKRVHSKGYHDYRTYLKENTTMVQKTIDEKASEFGLATLALCSNVFALHNVPTGMRACLPVLLGTKG